MAKKRKQSNGVPRAPQEQVKNRDEGKLILNSYEDVANSEDDFHIQRDKILLEEGPAHKRQRRVQEEGKYCQIQCNSLLTFEHRGIT